MTSKAQHLHPIALLYFLFRDIKNMILPFVVFVIAIANVLPNVPFVLMIVIVTFLVLATSIIRFYRFTFQLKQDEIVIKHGIFVRNDDHVPYDRIQNITTDQWFFLKPFGVEKLEIETASHAEKSEVTLFAVPISLKDQLETLRNQKNISQKEVTVDESDLAQVNDTSTAETSDDISEENTYSITKRDLIKFALTSPAFLSGLLVVLAAYGKFEQAISNQVYEYLFNQAAHLGILIVILVIVAVLLLFYIGSVLILINQYYGFKLVEKKNQFITTKGFFKTRKTTVSLKRVQAVLVKQPLLRQWLNIATVQLVIISNSKQGESEKDIIVMPVIVVGKVDDFLKQFFPSIPVEKIKPYRPSKWTYYYNLRNATLLTILNSIVLIVLLHFWPWLCVILVILNIVFWFIPAVLTIKRTNAQILDENFIAIRNNRIMTKQLVLIPRQTIQSAEKRQSVWLERKQVASLTINLRSGTTKRKINANYQLENDIDKIMDWYKDL